VGGDDAFRDEVCGAYNDSRAHHQNRQLVHSRSVNLSKRRKPRHRSWPPCDEGKRPPRESPS
jgi:hypothetical protein